MVFASSLLTSLLPVFSLLSYGTLHRASIVHSYWYDNYGLAVSQQLQDLMRTRRFVGLLILGIPTVWGEVSQGTQSWGVKDQGGNFRM